MTEKQFFLSVARDNRSSSTAIHTHVRNDFVELDRQTVKVVNGGMRFLKLIWEIFKPTRRRIFIAFCVSVFLALIHYLLFQFGLTDYLIKTSFSTHFFAYLFSPSLLFSGFFFLPDRLFGTLIDIIGNIVNNDTVVFVLLTIYGYIENFLSWYIITCIIGFIVHKLKKNRKR